MSRIAYLALGVLIGGWMTRPKTKAINVRLDTDDTLSRVINAVRRGGAIRKAVRG